MDNSSQLVRPLKSLGLHLPPSCIEFCPAFPSYFLVGTYCLEPETPNLGSEGAESDANAEAQSETEEDSRRRKQPQSRNGSIIVFQLLSGDVTPLQTIPQPSAILDLRFNPNDGSRDVCAVVSSTATLALFRLSPGPSEGQQQHQQPLKHVATMDLAALSRGAIGPPPDGTEILFLSFCWHPSRPDLAAVTTSTGHVYIVHIPILDEGNSWELRPEPVITHMLETWCAAISPAATIPSDSKQQSEDGGRQGGAEVVEKEAVFRVYSGGDDSMLRFTTCRWGREGLLTDTISPRDSRGHDAGATAILPLFIEEQDGIQHELVVTGSYDERIRLFAIPLRIGGGKAKNLAESSLGGGVWRLKLIDLDRRAQPDYSWRARILASCMHAGVRIVELTGTAASEYHFRVLCRFEEHKSMNYGSDYQPGWRDKLSVVSTSFYDNLLCLWEFASP